MTHSSRGASPHLLKMEHIAKRFGTTVALADVSLEVRAGEVHALVGENGAGKSTLMKILAGAEVADIGTIEFMGKPFAPRQPLDSLRMGISMIYQEFNLAPHLSVAANLLLGREKRRGGIFLASRFGSDEYRACRAALARLNMNLPLETRVGDLGVADQQMVEIARAFLSESRLIIMDEPTSALASDEVERLFGMIRQLRAAGIGIIYISHFLEELDRIADRITVIRDGRTVERVERQKDEGRRQKDESESAFPRAVIIKAMVGREVSEMYPRVPHSIGGVLLEARGLSGGVPRGVSFVLHRGEILGIAGLVGAGRTEMLRGLFGLDPLSEGEAVMNGVKVQRFSPHDWKGRGVGMVSEDRKSEGLAQSLSCLANMTLPALGRESLFGFVNRSAQREEAGKIGGALGIRWQGPDQNAAALSGGNQQKVALARLLYTRADVLLLDEPTRGIDVGAKVDIYRAIGELAAAGKAVVVVSSYLPELFGICDRMAVMCRGRLSGVFDVNDISAEQVMHLAVGD